MSLPGLLNGLGGVPSPIVDDPTGPPAESLSLINTGANAAQELKHVVHVRRFVDFDVTITEASQLFPWKSGLVKLDLSGEAINYISISPSVRANPVVAWIDQSEASWAQPAGAGTNYYPLPDLHVPGSSPTVVYPIPVRENHVILLTVVPAAWPYVDKIRVGFGYLPNLNERLIYDLG